MRLSALIAVALVLAAALVPDAADAQRRRPRPRRPRPPETTAPAETPADGATPPQNPYEAGTAATPAPEAGNGATGSVAAGGGGAQQAAQQQPQRPETGGASAGATSGTGADAAASATPDDTAIADEPLAPDLGPLRSEYTAIMDELVQVRSRVAVLGQQLFDTKIRIVVQNRAGDDQNLERLALSLDGAPVFRAPGAEVAAEDGRRVFDGFAAPGPHVLGVELEQRARANDGYRYTMRDSYRVEVVRGRMTVVTIVLDDDSNIAEDFEDDGEGEYDVRVRVRVATREMER